MKRFEGTQSYVATDDLKVAVNAAVTSAALRAAKARSITRDYTANPVSSMRRRARSESAAEHGTQRYRCRAERVLLAGDSGSAPRLRSAAIAATQTHGKRSDTVAFGRVAPFSQAA